MPRNGSSPKAQADAEPLIRIGLKLLPDDWAKLKFLQFKRAKGKPSSESYSDLAHELWLKRLPDPPKHFRIRSRRTPAST